VNNHLDKLAILHYAAPPIVGGVESTIYHHARLLVDNGYLVEIIAGIGEKFHPQIEVSIIPEINSRNPKVLEVGKSLAKGEVNDDFFGLRDHIFESLELILTGVRVCIVHNAITLHKNLPLTAALRRISDEKGTRIIAWCHDFAWQDNLYFSELYPGYPWDLLRNAWPDLLYVAVSEHRKEMLATMLKLPSEIIKVVPPGIDIEHFWKLEPLTATLVKKLNLLEAVPLLLLPARITRRKNIEFGIRVIAALTVKMPKAMLVITGPPGPHNPKNITYLEQLMSLCQELGVVDNVKFLYQQGEGNEPLFISDAVIADFYRLSDALLFPSKREGFGIPILEAGLARLPVFAADIPAIQESAGAWIRRFKLESDPIEVAELIAVSLKDELAYLLKHRVVNQFSWPQVIKVQVIPLIERASGNC
jgi:glycosyltransferase involved in cell wall biosynthesis